MARSDIVTLLPLDRYAQIMGIYAPHFNQLAGNTAPAKSGGQDGCVWDQEARDDLAWTIAQAEELIANELGFFPIPKFVTNEHTGLGLGGVRSDWRQAELKTEYAHMEGLGTEKLTLLEADVNVTYTNDNNNPLGRLNLATIGSGVYNNLSACGSECEVAVFFRVADGAKDAADSKWEIKPITVDIDDSNMTVKAEASMFVDPDLWKLTKADSDRPGSEGSNNWIINYDESNFVEAVDVYCRTLDPELPITLKWDGWCRCTTSPCAHDTQTACGLVTDTRRSFYIPRPATWNGTTNVEATPKWALPPESVMVNYRAGLPLFNCRMNSNLERAIVKLTNALLPEPPCGFCDAAQNKWSEDRKNVDPLTDESANLPWDMYRQGALEAWRVVKRLRMGAGSKMGRGYR